MKLALSAVGLNALSFLLLFADIKWQQAKALERDEQDDQSAVSRHHNSTPYTLHSTFAGKASLNAQLLGFGAVMSLLCVGVAISLPIFNPENTVWFSMKRIALLSILWPVAYMDFKSLRIPNIFILAGLAYRIIALPFELVFEPADIWRSAGADLIAAAVLGVSTFLCGLVVKNSIGLGDVKLLIVMGLLLGLTGIWSAIFVSLFISFAISIILLITKKKKRKDVIPFAPSIMLGTYISVFLTGG